MPRIHQRYTQRLKIDDIAGHNRHAMDERGGRNKSIAVRTRVWNMEGSTALGHRCINREYAAYECGQ